jgi:hypothetical protein
VRVIGGLRDEDGSSGAFDEVMAADVGHDFGTWEEGGVQLLFDLLALLMGLSGWKDIGRNGNELPLYRNPSPCCAEPVSKKLSSLIEKKCVLITTNQNLKAYPTLSVHTIPLF